MNHPHAVNPVLRKTRAGVSWQVPWAWNGCVPVPLQQAAPWHDDQAHGDWCEYVGQKQGPGAASEPPSPAPESFLWGMRCVAPEAPQRKLASLAREIKRWAGANKKRSQVPPSAWHALLEPLSGSGEPEPAWAVLHHLLLARALPAATRWCARNSWWGLLSRLVSSIRHAQRLLPEQDPIRWQLVGGELPLLLAREFPELAPLNPLATQARRVLAAGLVQLCDGQGLLHGRHLDLFPLLLGCWTRCLMAHPHKPPWTTKAQDQYDWAVRQMLRLLRADGSWSFGPPGPLAADRSLVQQALLLAGDRYDRAMARRSLPPSWKKQIPAPPEQREPRLLPPASYQSDWAQAALLQPHWDHRCPHLWVRHPGQGCLVELGNRGQLLLQGEVQLQLHRNGQLLQPRSEWSCVLWEADADGDYLELELSLSERVTLYRHVFLAREDRFLLLADAVLGPETPAEWEYGLSLPLAPSIHWQGEPETTEGLLQNSRGQALALIMPLAAPEWRIACRRPPLEQQQEQLVVRHRQRGSKLVVPLFFDLDPRRLRRQRTWRRLTVAQQRQVVEPDRACGFRIQSGQDQWVFYRSLDGIHNRTLLGVNVYCELSLRRFLPEGTTEMLIETLPE